jgi:hypothetical protein
MAVTPPVWTARHSARERVAHAVALASRLLARERENSPETSSTALAQTVPAPEAAHTTSPQTPKARQP